MTTTTNVAIMVLMTFSQFATQTQPTDQHVPVIWLDRAEFSSTLVAVAPDDTVASFRPSEIAAALEFAEVDLDDPAAEIRTWKHELGETLWVVR